MPEPTVTPLPTETPEGPPPTATPTPLSSAVAAEQCRKLLSEIDAERFEYSQREQRQKPPALATDDTVGACVLAVEQGYNLETVVGWFEETDFSSALNAKGAALREDEPSSALPTPEPLGPIIGTSSNGVTTLFFACTGSMEPAITCEDQADGIRPTSHADIDVGTIVAFSPPGGCLSGSTVHRVIDEREVGGEYSYRTQGDSNPNPDPCWIPYANIEYIVTNIRPCSDPRCSGNADIRQNVNAAKAAFETAEAKLKEIEAERERHWETIERYQLSINQLPDGTIKDVDCGTNFNRSYWCNKAKNEYNRLTIEHTEQVAVRNAALALYNCWYAYAKSPSTALECEPV